jgi:hypothetical protein
LDNSPKSPAWLSSPVLISDCPTSRTPDSRFPDSRLLRHYSRITATHTRNPHLLSSRRDARFAHRMSTGHSPPVVAEALAKVMGYLSSLSNPQTLKPSFLSTGALGSLSELTLKTPLLKTSFTPHLPSQFFPLRILHFIKESQLLLGS